MEDTIILYASSVHLNSVLVIAKFINKHHPSISIIILSNAPDSAASSITSEASSITYHRLPTPDIPPNIITNPVELLFEVPRLNNPNVKQYLEQISQKTNVKAFIIDFFCNSAFEVSTSLNIPTYFYVSSGGFGLCAFLHFPTTDEIIPQDIGDLNDYLEIPGCPPVHSLDFPKGMFFRHTNTHNHFLDTARNMRKANGILVNSFDALEYRSKAALLNGICVPNGPTPQVLFVAPLVTGMNSRKGDSEHECLSWLDSQPSKSVIFLCFGRKGFFSKQQLQEIATGLENSGHRFLWSVRNPPGINNEDPDLETLLPEGFLERTKERGFVIKSWAPQKEVLSHESVGGFVTHCGRSSILEAVSFGVPMIGFPIYAEQRMNRVFMVEEMKVSLPLDEAGDGLVTSGELEKRVKELMGSVSGKAIRQRVNELKVSGEAAVKEGGSSVVDLDKFIKLVIG
uniref:Glycosyltransferase n=1 Tax=Veronica persica TaxID=138560 RepID=C0STS8_VERPE|nr:flavonoid glycosyltransferase [Veronica persica]